MSTRRARSLTLRPALENLESRKLLSKTVSGTDADGDTWTLTLFGPGDVRVVNQTGSDGNPIPLGQPANIDTITIAGADPLSSRLVGHVTKSATGDGKVFFQTMKELGGASEGTSANNGIHVIDMPNFWLGRTSTVAPTAGTNAAELDIPDGVNTLRFGGADTTFTPTGGTPLNQGTVSTVFNIALGLPRTQGTSIIIDRSITSGKPAAGTTAAIHNEVEFHTLGRLNVFQANAIDGNTAETTTGFENGGGTIVIASDGFENRAVTQILAGQIVGPMGFVRVGNNATNFSVQSSDKISNLFIGGETNNVFVLAAQGLRNVYFGKGMDTTTIAAHTIFTLEANRGALNSNVTSDRTIAQTIIGGDVVNTNVIAGVNQGLTAIFHAQAAPTTTQPTQDGGAIQDVLIAGDVKDSVFAASVDPLNGTFGNDDLNFPNGRIKAKVEGTIDNATATPDSPSQAFYAKSVSVFHGPVIPPSVPEAPFPNAGAPPSGKRIANGLQPTSTHNTSSSSSSSPSVRTASVASHPRGPAKAKK
jgi:hypothetical protein